MDPMARPHPTAKQSVNLASNLASPRSPTSQAPRPSRIRRDPPPAVKAKVVVDPEERDQWTVIVGILTFALAFFVIIIAFGSYSGWSPREYTVEVTAAE